MFREIGDLSLMVLIGFLIDTLLDIIISIGKSFVSSSPLSPANNACATLKTSLCDAQQLKTREYQLLNNRLVETDGILLPAVRLDLQASFRFADYK